MDAKHYTLILFAMALLGACGQTATDGKRPCYSNNCGTDLQPGDDSTIPEEPGGTGSTNPNDASFQCSATPSSNYVGHNELFSLNVTVSGGIGPYSVPGFISSFASTTQVRGGYFNTGTQDKLISRTLSVKDARGNSASCSFAITVRPNGSGGTGGTGTGGTGNTGTPGVGNSTGTNGVSCSIAYDKSPRIDQPVEFTITVTGTDRAEFDTFYPQQNWSVAVAKVSNTQAKKSIIYKTAGVRTASIHVRGGGGEATCSLPLAVRKPAVTLAATPSARGVFGGSIEVKAIAEGFDPDSTKTFTFTASDLNVEVTSANEVATVRSKLAYHHETTLNVSVTNTVGELSQAKIQLIFTSRDPVACKLIATPYKDLYVNQNISFEIKDVTSVSNAQRIEVQEFNGGWDGIRAGTDPTSNPVAFSYTRAGWKHVIAKARTVDTKVPCNGDGKVEEVFLIRNGVANTGCNIVATQQQSRVGMPNLFKISLPAPQPVGPFSVQFVTTSPDWSPAATPNPMEYSLTFRAQGVYHIGVTVQDLSRNQTTQCFTDHTAVP